MKTLPICAAILALLCLSPVASARKPGPPVTTLTNSCGESCVMTPRDENGQFFVAVTGTGYDTRSTYGLCVDAPTISFCAGISQPVGEDGVLHSGFSTGQPGTYCMWIVEAKRFTQVSPYVCSTLSLA